jgi:hypothetical protein
MYFEGLGGASVVNGVLRVETFYRNARGEDVSGGEFLLPANRVVPVVEALQSLIEQIRSQDGAAASSDAVAKKK